MRWIRISVSCLVLAVCLGVMLFLGGCAGPALNDFDQKIEESRMTAKTECHKARAAGETARMAQVASLPQDQRALVIAMDAMSRQAEALSGKDPCGTGMAAHEARVAIARSQNEVIGAVAPIAAAGATTYGVVNSVTRFGAKAMERAGSQTTNNIQGDGNKTSDTHVSTVSDVSNDVSAGGDNAAPSITNGSTSGPDMSAPVTTTNNTGIVPEGSTLAGSTPPATE